MLSTLISLPANLTDERYRIDGFDISNLTINADTDTGVLIEFLNCTGTPTLGTGVTEFFTPTQTTVELTADLPTGFYVLRNLDSNVNLFEGTHTTGAATDIASLDNAASTTNYRLYYLPQFISSGTKRFYQVTTTDFINDSGSGDKIVTASATEIADVLTVDAENTTPGSETGTFSLPTSTTGQILLAGATSQLSAANTQRLMLLARETASSGSSLYLQLMANNEVTIEYILPVIQAGTGANSDVITLTATDQQVITAYARTNENAGIATFDAGGKTFFSVIVLANPAGLSSGEAETACRAALRIGTLTKIGQ